MENQEEVKTEEVIKEKANVSSDPRNRSQNYLKDSARIELDKNGILQINMLAQALSPLTMALVGLIDFVAGINKIIQENGMITTEDPNAISKTKSPIVSTHGEPLVSDEKAVEILPDSDGEMKPKVKVFDINSKKEVQEVLAEEQS